MNDVEIAVFVGSSLVGAISPAFINGSFLQKVIFGITSGVLYGVTMMIIKS